jgi:hypothetical protein
MSAPRRWWRPAALGLVLLVGLCGCVAGPGYYDEGIGVGFAGGYYEPYESFGYAYGNWAPGFFVGPPRGYLPRRLPRRGPHGARPRRPYRPAPPARPIPSIPTHPRPRPVPRVPRR